MVVVMVAVGGAFVVVDLVVAEVKVAVVFVVNLFNMFSYIFL